MIVLLGADMPSRDYRRAACGAFERTPGAGILSSIERFRKTDGKPEPLAPCRILRQRDIHNKPLIGWARPEHQGHISFGGFIYHDYLTI